MTVRDTPLTLGDGRFVVPGNRWDLLDGVRPEPTPTVSVIVPYYQGQDRLDRLLVALAAQTHPLDHLQVIVADDGSPTPPIVRAPAGLRVEVVTQDDRGFRAAAARNLGAAAADGDGDVLCFLDDDTVPEPDYVRAVTRLPALLPDALVTGRRRHVDLTGLEAPQTAAWLAGRGHHHPPVLPEPQWLIDEHEASANLLRIGPDSHRYVISAVMACSRRLFDEINGFDPRFARYGGEDWEFAHRALCAGAVLAHVPDAVAWHDGPSWADRGDGRSRRRTKNAETSTIIGLIPPARGRGEAWTARPNVVVEIGTHDEEAAAVIVAVRSVLTGDVDAGVWLAGPSAHALVVEYFPFDPRVSAGPPDPAVVASARIHASCSRPLRFVVDAWTPLLDRLGPNGDGPGVGQIVVDTGDGELVMTTTAALARARRWSSDVAAADLVADLYERAVLGTQACGVTAVVRAPDLAHELKHLLDR